MNLQEYEKNWMDFLINLNDKKIEELGISAKRAKLYQGFVNQHYVSAIKKMYPRAINAIDIDWNHLIKSYYKKFPPSSYELNELSYKFPDFFKAYNMDLKDQYPFIFDLLIYELMEFQVYVSKNNYPQNNSFYLNPSIKIIEFSYDIASWVFQRDKSSKHFDFSPIKRISLTSFSRNHQTNLTEVNNLGAIHLIVIRLAQDILADDSVTSIDEKQALLKAKTLLEVEQLIDSKIDQNIIESNIDESLNFLISQNILILSE